MNLAVQDRRRRGVRSVVMITLTCLMAIPLYYIVISTFKTPFDMARSPFGLPTTWTLDHYRKAFTDTGIVRSFFNSLFITIIAVFFQVVIGSMAAFGMILRKSRLTAAIGAMLLVAFCIPLQTTLIPLYQMEASWGLVNTLSGVILIYMSGAVFCYFLIVGYMRTLPMEILEAARIDGAGAWRIYASIVLPLIRPILIAVVVFQTLGTWNDFIWPNVLLSSSSKKTIILQVYNAVGQFTTNWPLFMAITVLALIPVFIFFLFCQRWIVSGLVAGSIKG